MTKKIVPFNWPYLAGDELDYIEQAHKSGRLAGDGPFTERCHQWLQARTGAQQALLTHSCTAALEMSALLLNIQAGDEIIMPSYTFVSTANAFVLRGAVPVFVDIRADTLNLNEALIEQAITTRTRAIVPVHYAGVSCEMESIMAIAARHELHVVEDAAQGSMASYKGRPLGSIGDLGTLSFHETKNLISGEGGSLLINREEYSERAEIIREKGTDRSRFFRGQVDKYTWQDVGSSFLPGEMTAAFLWAQFEQADRITHDRLLTWDRYHSLLEPLEVNGHIRRPIVPEGCEHNAHMYYILLPSAQLRKQVIRRLSENGISSVFHYIPLHSSPAGKRLARAAGTMQVTDDISERLIRLPLWVGMNTAQQDAVLETLISTLSVLRDGGAKVSARVEPADTSFKH